MMPNLADEAEAEYARIGEGRYSPVPVKVRTDKFDFLTSQEISGVPIHIIEAQREQQCYSDAADRGTALRDFITSIGIQDSDIEVPENGQSALRIDKSMRAYLGEQEGEPYRFFLPSIVPYAEDMEWLKCTTFLDNQTADECERQRCIDRSVQKRWNAGAMIPFTAYKQAFFAKTKRKKTAL